MKTLEPTSSRMVSSEGGITLVMAIHLVEKTQGAGS
jgi:hypothetical protein